MFSNVLPLVNIRCLVSLTLAKSHPLLYMINIMGGGGGIMIIIIK